MGFVVNVIAILTIIIAYSLIMTIAQNGFALTLGLARRPATRMAAVVTAFISSLLACCVAITVHEFGLRKLGFALSVWPLIVWGVLQLVGIARSWGSKRVSLIQAGNLIVTGGHPDAPRYLFLGQFYGLLTGLAIMIAAHFTIR